MQRSLLIGCGNSREKKVFLKSQEWAGKLTTVDMNPDCGADIVMDLTRIFNSVHPEQCTLGRQLPFEEETFDEIGAYDCLEHWGNQGDWRSWFAEMAEYHRVLKPGGTMGIIVPVGEDALADPGHTRFFGMNHFRMLSQQWYHDALAKGMQVTDYRWYWRENFDVLYLQEIGGHHIAVLLRKS